MRGRVKTLGFIKIAGRAGIGIMFQISVVNVQAVHGGEGFVSGRGVVVLVGLPYGDGCGGGGGGGGASACVLGRGLLRPTNVREVVGLLTEVARFPHGWALLLGTGMVPAAVGARLP